MAAVAPPELSEIRAAAGVLRGVLAPTPLLRLREDAPGATSAPLWLKPEIHQPVGSFKLRGVHHALHRLGPEGRARGVSTVSAGNTAQALAWSARHFGVPARSLMPVGAPAAKVAAVRALGATPVQVPTEEVFRYLREERWRAEPWAFVHPWIDRDVLVGHGTLGLEILAELAAVESVFLPVGGGGLLAGVASALKALRPGVRIVAVEPEGCPSLHAALAAGRPVEVACRTICDGVAVPYVTAELFGLLRSLVDESVLVPEASVRAAVRRLALGEHMVAEPSGALALAAALEQPPGLRGISVAVVTGGSIDAARLAEILLEPGSPEGAAGQVVRPAGT